jgi:hypothetical protein
MFPCWLLKVKSQVLGLGFWEEPQPLAQLLDDQCRLSLPPVSLLAETVLKLAVITFCGSRAYLKEQSFRKLQLEFHPSAWRSHRSIMYPFYSVQ